MLLRHQSLASMHAGDWLQVWLVRNANREVLRQQEVSSLSSWLLQLWTVAAPAFMWFRAVGM